MDTQETTAKAGARCPNCGRSFNCEGPPECWCLKVEHDFDWEGFIMRATLTGANLTDAKSLTQDQLDSACISKGGKPPILPKGLKPPHNVCMP